LYQIFTFSVGKHRHRQRWLPANIAQGSTLVNTCNHVWKGFVSAGKVIHREPQRQNGAAISRLNAFWKLAAEIAMMDEGARRIDGASGWFSARASAQSLRSTLRASRVKVGRHGQ
jgi:hypothetical protein